MALSQDPGFTTKNMAISFREISRDFDHGLMGLGWNFDGDRNEWRHPAFLWQKTRHSRPSLPGATCSGQKMCRTTTTIHPKRIYHENPKI